MKEVNQAPRTELVKLVHYAKMKYATRRTKNICKLRKTFWPARSNAKPNNLSTKEQKTAFNSKLKNANNCYVWIEREKKNKYLAHMDRI